MLSHLGKDVGELFTLPLGTDVGAQPPLQVLQCPLILGNLQQFHGTPLVRGMTDNFTDKVPDELGVLGGNTLVSGGPDALGPAKVLVLLGRRLGDSKFLGLVALVKAHSNFVPWSHARRKHGEKNKTEGTRLWCRVT